MSLDKRGTVYVVRKNVAEMIEIEDTRYTRAGRMLIERGERGFARRNDSSFLRTASARGPHLDEAWCAVVDCFQLDRATDRMCPCLSLYVTGMPQQLITEPYLGVTIFL